MTLVELTASLKLFYRERGPFRTQLRDILAGAATDDAGHERDELAQQVYIIEKVLAAIAQEERTRNAISAEQEKLKELCFLAAKDPQIAEQLNSPERLDTIIRSLRTLPSFDEINFQLLPNTTYHSFENAIEEFERNQNIQGVAFAATVDKSSVLNTYIDAVIQAYTPQIGDVNLTPEAQSYAQTVVSQLTPLKNSFSLVPTKQENTVDTDFHNAIEEVVDGAPAGPLATVANRVKQSADTNTIPHAADLLSLQTLLLESAKEYRKPFAVFKFDEDELSLAENIKNVFQGIYSWLYKKPELEQWSGFTSLAQAIKDDLADNFKANYSKTPVVEFFRHNVGQVNAIKDELNTVIRSKTTNPCDKPDAVFAVIIDKYKAVLDSATGEKSLKGGYLKQLQTTLQRFEGTMSEVTKARYLALRIEVAMRIYLHDKRPGELKQAWANLIKNDMRQFTVDLSPDNAAQKIQEMLTYSMSEATSLVLYDKKVYAGGISRGTHRLHAALTGAIDEIKPLLSQDAQDYIAISEETRTLAKEHNKLPAFFNLNLPTDVASLGDSRRPAARMSRVV